MCTQLYCTAAGAVQSIGGQYTAPVVQYRYMFGTRIRYSVDSTVQYSTVLCTRYYPLPGVIELRYIVTRRPALTAPVKQSGNIT